MNHNNLTLKISNHAIERLFDRLINPEFVKHASEDERKEYAETVIREMFKESYYLKDVKGTIYFRAYDYKVDLLVSDMRIITILPVNDRKVRREKKKEKREKNEAEKVV